MKITKNKLRQVIKEELENIAEANIPMEDKIIALVQKAKDALANNRIDLAISLLDDISETVEPNRPF
jgi:hypothetical protein